MLDSGGDRRAPRRRRGPETFGSGLCLEPHDLVISKYAAGREKDRDYVRTAVRGRLVERGVLLERLEKTPLDTERRRSLRAQIDADFTGA